MESTQESEPTETSSGNPPSEPETTPPSGPSTPPPPDANAVEPSSPTGSELTAPAMGRPMLAHWRRGFWEWRRSSQQGQYALRQLLMLAPPGAKQRAYQKGLEAAKNFPGQYIAECWTEAQLVTIAIDLATNLIDLDQTLNGVIVRSPRRDNQLAAIAEGLARIRKKA